MTRFLQAFLTRGLGRSRSALALVLGVLLTLAGCGNPDGDWQLPPQDATTAAHVDWLYYFIFWLCVFYFAHIMLAMLWFMWRYRRRPGVEPEPSPHHNLPLEIAWSIPPAFLVVLMFYWGFTGYINVSTPPADAYKIQAVAKQWDFRYVYPNGVVDTELHVPMGEPVEIVLESEDVLHAFYIPNYRIKQDIVPGRFTEVWFTATRPSAKNADGSLKRAAWAFCAEYCGDWHSTMKTAVFVHETRASFDAWLKSKDKPKRGDEVYEMFCKSCHLITPGITVGPSFKGLFGSQRQVFDPATGETRTITADAAYIEESIRQPGKLLSRQGKEFGNAMTAGLANNMKPAELKALIDYIETLK